MLFLKWTAPRLTDVLLLLAKHALKSRVHVAVEAVVSVPAAVTLVAVIQDVQAAAVTTVPVVADHATSLSH